MATTMPCRRRLKPSPGIPLTLPIFVISILFSCTSFVHAVPKGTQDFVNNSMPTIRPIFVVNFGMASVICQSTNNESDIRIHDMSILCDGKKDCFDNPAMNDESFPYCAQKCNSTCNNHGACLFDGKTSQCYCNTGFHGPSCEFSDVNECADKPCHWMAHCTNTYGSYSCSCFPGFAGDGVNCADIDECELGKAACPENSRCVNLPGSHLCNCTEGYMPKGSPVEKCVDIDECEAGLHECAEGTMCQNTLGSYLCTYNCDSGYETVNGKCVDINECSKHGVCDKRATCVNTPGSYKCQCDEGFTGDGQICTPLMSCLESDEICDRHASCVFGQCHCKTGYYGDGMNCFDVDECKGERPPCRGSKEPQCVNTDGGYICCDENLSPAECIKKKGAYCSGGCGHGAVCFGATCNCLPGLRGDPMVRCTDINECEEDAICPGVGQRCINTYGSYTCCPADSADGGCAGLTLVADSELSQSQAAAGHSEAAAAARRRKVLTQQGGFQRNETGGRLAIVRHGHADINKASGNLRGPITCEVGGIGCPPFSNCLEGVCKCHAGYDWNDYTRLCEDVNECDELRYPCPRAGQWCVNSVGSYHCCTPGVRSSECSGLEIIPMEVDGSVFEPRENGLDSEGNASGSGSAGYWRRGVWRTVTYGQWHNFSAGRIVVGRGRIYPSKLQPTDNEEQPHAGADNRWGLEIHAKERNLPHIQIPDADINRVTLQNEGGERHNSQGGTLVIERRLNATHVYINTEATKPPTAEVTAESDGKHKVRVTHLKKTRVITEEDTTHLQSSVHRQKVSEESTETEDWLLHPDAPKQVLNIRPKPVTSSRTVHSEVGILRNGTVFHRPIAARGDAAPPTSITNSAPSDTPSTELHTPVSVAATEEPSSVSENEVGLEISFNPGDNREPTNESGSSGSSSTHGNVETTTTDLQIRNELTQRNTQNRNAKVEVKGRNEFKSRASTGNDLPDLGAPTSVIPKSLNDKLEFKIPITASSSPSTSSAPVVPTSPRHATSNGVNPVTSSGSVTANRSAVVSTVTLPPITRNLNTTKSPLPNSTTSATTSSDDAHIRVQSREGSEVSTEPHATPRTLFETTSEPFPGSTAEAYTDSIIHKVTPTAQAPRTSDAAVTSQSSESTTAPSVPSSTTSKGTSGRAEDYSSAKPTIEASRSTSTTTPHLTQTSPTRALSSEATTSRTNPSAQSTTTTALPTPVKSLSTSSESHPPIKLTTALDDAAKTTGGVAASSKPSASNTQAPSQTSASTSTTKAIIRDRQSEPSATMGLRKSATVAPHLLQSSAIQVSSSFSATSQAARTSAFPENHSASTPTEASTSTPLPGNKIAAKSTKDVDTTKTEAESSTSTGEYESKPGRRPANDASSRPAMQPESSSIGPGIQDQASILRNRSSTNAKISGADRREASTTTVSSHELGTTRRPLPTSTSTPTEPSTFPSTVTFDATSLNETATLGAALVAERVQGNRSMPTRHGHSTLILSVTAQPILIMNANSSSPAEKIDHTSTSRFITATSFTSKKTPSPSVRTSGTGEPTTTTQLAHTDSTVPKQSQPATTSAAHKETRKSATTGHATLDEATSSAHSGQLSSSARSTSGTELPFATTPASASGPIHSESLATSARFGPGSEATSRATEPTAANAQPSRTSGGKTQPGSTEDTTVVSTASTAGKNEETTQSTKDHETREAGTSGDRMVLDASASSSLRTSSPSAKSLRPTAPTASRTAITQEPSSRGSESSTIQTSTEKATVASFTTTNILSVEPDDRDWILQPEATPATAHTESFTASVQGSDTTPFTAASAPVETAPPLTVVDNESRVSKEKYVVEGDVRAADKHHESGYFVRKQSRTHRIKTTDIDDTLVDDRRSVKTLRTKVLETEVIEGDTRGRPGHSSKTSNIHSSAPSTSSDKPGASLSTSAILSSTASAPSTSSSTSFESAAPTPITTAAHRATEEHDTTMATPSDRSAKKASKEIIDEGPSGNEVGLEISSQTIPPEVGLEIVAVNAGSGRHNASLSRTKDTKAGRIRNGDGTPPFVDEYPDETDTANRPDESRPKGIRPIETEVGTDSAEDHSKSKSRNQSSSIETLTVDLGSTGQAQLNFTQSTTPSSGVRQPEDATRFGLELGRIEGDVAKMRTWTPTPGSIDSVTNAEEESSTTTDDFPRPHEGIPSISHEQVSHSTTSDVTARSSHESTTDEAKNDGSGSGQSKVNVFTASPAIETTSASNVFTATTPIAPEDIGISLDASITTEVFHLPTSDGRNNSEKNTGIDGDDFTTLPKNTEHESTESTTVTPHLLGESLASVGPSLHPEVTPAASTQDLSDRTESVSTEATEVSSATPDRLAVTSADGAATTASTRSTSDADQPTTPPNGAEESTSERAGHDKETEASTSSLSKNTSTNSPSTSVALSNEPLTGASDGTPAVPSQLNTSGASATLGTTSGPREDGAVTSRGTSSSSDADRRTTPSNDADDGASHPAGQDKETETSISSLSSADTAKISPSLPVTASSGPLTAASAEKTTVSPSPSTVNTTSATFKTTSTPQEASTPRSTQTSRTSDTETPTLTEVSKKFSRPIAHSEIEPIPQGRRRPQKNKNGKTAPPEATERKPDNGEGTVTTVNGNVQSVPSAVSSEAARGGSSTTPSITSRTVDHDISSATSTPDEVHQTSEGGTHDEINQTEGRTEQHGLDTSTSSGSSAAETTKPDESSESLQTTTDIGTSVAGKTSTGKSSKTQASSEIAETTQTIRIASTEPDMPTQSPVPEGVASEEPSTTASTGSPTEPSTPRLDAHSELTESSSATSLEQTLSTSHAPPESSESVFDITTPHTVPVKDWQPTAAVELSEGTSSTPTEASSRRSSEAEVTERATTGSTTASSTSATSTTESPRSTTIATEVSPSSTTSELVETTSAGSVATEPAETSATKQTPTETEREGSTTSSAATDTRAETSTLSTVELVKASSTSSVDNNDDRSASTVPSPSSSAEESTSNLSDVTTPPTELEARTEAAPTTASTSSRTADITVNSGHVKTDIRQGGADTASTLADQTTPTDATSREAESSTPATVDARIHIRTTKQPSTIQPLGRTTLPTRDRDHDTDGTPATTIGIPATSWPQIATTSTFAPHKSTEIADDSTFKAGKNYVHVVMATTARANNASPDSHRRPVEVVNQEPSASRASSTLAPSHLPTSRSPGNSETVIPVEEPTRKATVTEQPATPPLILVDESDGSESVSGGELRPKPSTSSKSTSLRTSTAPSRETPRKPFDYSAVSPRKHSSEQPRATATVTVDAYPTGPPTFGRPAGGSRIVTSTPGSVTSTTQATLPGDTAETQRRPSVSTEQVPEKSDSNSKDSFPLQTSPPPTLQTRGPGVQCASGDDCALDAYCERRTGACRCKPGFRGLGSGQCLDINECEEKLDDCHATASCSNFVGGYSCLCAIGYRKSEDGVCEDINECHEQSETICHFNANCVNLPGSYVCQCKSGYTGDGYSCVPIDYRRCSDEEWRRSDCGRNQICVSDVHNGALACDICKPGFEMRNGVCADVDECHSSSISPCHPDAKCVNHMGSFKCECQPGYCGDGFNCLDINECIHSPCHPQAACVNVPGSFQCTCPDGWTGDGISTCLNPLDLRCEHQRPDFCRSTTNSACLSVVVGEELTSLCECSNGYRYNPRTRTCEDIDECLEARHDCDLRNSVCVNKPGTFTCECASGFYGVGGVCVDIDECRQGTSKCHSMAFCTNLVGRCTCQCAHGLTGNGTHCYGNFPVSHPTQAQCTDEWVQMCGNLNKTCHVDDEEVPQCGSCLIGYQPVKGDCKPVHAVGSCAELTARTCDINAECVDVHPSNHFCVCKVGFIGDGTRCDDVDECSIPGLCDRNAHCQNTNGSFSCVCKDGYSGSGFKCTPSHDSSANCLTDPGVCHARAMCQPDGTCKCADGYTGDGRTTCHSQLLQLPKETHSSTSVLRGSNTTSDSSLLTVPPPACSKTDHTACHVLATCDEKAQRCVCRNGFDGDGYTSCTKISIDCTDDSGICDSNAFCDKNTRECRCSDGYIGDGVFCVPDRLDCVLRPALCGEHSKCLGRRCQCIEGYTGDGSLCMSLHRSNTSNNCLACHCKADCVDNNCVCQAGFFGNGIMCVPDPQDCVNYPGVCHVNGICRAETRRCECKKGFDGNGIDCGRRLSCRDDPSLCHEDADCLSTGHCKCKSGLFGDGTYCSRRVSAEQLMANYALQSRFKCEPACGDNSECVNGACKCIPGFIANQNGICIDVDECATGIAACHHLAACTNTYGSYECHCPNGASGDGRDCYQSDEIKGLTGLRVQCTDDGMRLVLADDNQPFEGRVFVKGQNENPFCSKTFSPLKQSHDRPTMHIPIAHCNMDLESNNTFAVTVIIQKHPAFITEAAYAYRLRCRYPTPARTLMTHFNVTELTTSQTVMGQGPKPLCALNVTNEEDISIDSAIVGQLLKLSIAVSPKDTYSILPRNCFAINLESAERYSLTDAAGCAVDTQLFPEWKRSPKAPHVAEAVFRTFKWPDTSMIRFECDCSACIGTCPTINCGRRKEVAGRRTRMRFARDHRSRVDDVEPADYLDEMNNKKLVNESHVAISPVLAVKDDEEEALAQKQLEKWLVNDISNIDGVYIEPTTEPRVCLESMWLLLTIVTMFGSFVLLSLSLRRYKQRYLTK